jgi:hypothetical protein
MKNLNLTSDRNYHHLCGMQLYQARRKRISSHSGEINIDKPNKLSKKVVGSNPKTTKVFCFYDAGFNLDSISILGAYFGE